MKKQGDSNSRKYPIGDVLFMFVECGDDQMDKHKPAHNVEDNKLEWTVKKM